MRGTDYHAVYDYHDYHHASCFLSGTASFTSGNHGNLELEEVSAPIWKCWLPAQLFVTPTLCDPWTVAHQAPLSMGLYVQEHWNVLPFLSPGDLPDPGIKSGSPTFTEYKDENLSDLFKAPTRAYKQN